MPSGINRLDFVTNFQPVSILANLFPRIALLDCGQKELAGSTQRHILAPFVRFALTYGHIYLFLFTNRNMNRENDRLPTDLFFCFIQHQKQNPEFGLSSEYSIMFQHTFLNERSSLPVLQKQFFSSLSSSFIYSFLGNSEIAIVGNSADSGRVPPVLSLDLCGEDKIHAEWIE